MAYNKEMAAEIQEADVPNVTRTVTEGVLEMGQTAVKRNMIKNTQKIGQNTGLKTGWEQPKTSISLGDLSNLIYDTLFPKIKMMHNIQEDLKNIYGPLMTVVSSVGQIVEEYAIADMYPSQLDLNDHYSLIFKANIPKIISRMYTNTVAKKVKITLDVKEVRLRFVNPESLIMYLENAVLAVYNAVARTEEMETNQMFVDHYRRNKLVNFEADSVEDFARKMIATYESMTVKSRRFNLANDIAKGLRYTTQSKGSNLYFLTTPNVSSYLNMTIFPYMFDKYGIDVRGKLLLIDEFPEIWTINVDYELTAADEAILANLDYTMTAGKSIEAGTVIQTDWVEAGFAATLNKETELTSYQFDNQDFGFVFDGRALRLYADEGAGWVVPQNNGELMQTHMWYHYSILKAISPFYNMATFSLKKPPKRPTDLDKPTDLQESNVTATSVDLAFTADDNTKSVLVYQDPSDINVQKVEAIKYTEGKGPIKVENAKFAGKTVKFAVQVFPNTYEGNDEKAKIAAAIASGEGSELSDFVEVTFPAETPR